MIVLDTHALIWLAEGAGALGKTSRRLSDRALAENRLAVSAVSFWETAMLSERGRLRLTQPVDVWRRALLEIGLLELPLTGEIGIMAASLPDFHADPADRFLVATATRNLATLLTAADAILRWPGKLNRQDARL